MLSSKCCISCCKALSINLGRSDAPMQQVTRRFVEVDYMKEDSAPYWHITCSLKRKRSLNTQVKCTSMYCRLDVLVLQLYTRNVRARNYLYNLKETQEKFSQVLRHSGVNDSSWMKISSSNVEKISGVDSSLTSCSHSPTQHIM